MIAGDDEDILLPLHLFTQTNGTDRIFQRAEHDFFLRRAGKLGMIGRQNRCKTLILHLKQLRTASIRDGNRRHG